MKKSIISFCGLLFLAIIFTANTSIRDNPLLGSWIFSVSQAPWEYSRGKVVFEKNDENVLTGKMLFSSGREIALSKITQEGERITLDFFVEGYPVKIIVTIADNNITGFAQTDDGNLPFSALKEMPEN